MKHRASSQLREAEVPALSAVSPAMQRAPDLCPEVPSSQKKKKEHEEKRGFLLNRQRLSE
jgi:hypothetical protein